MIQGSFSVFHRLRFQFFFSEENTMAHKKVERRKELDRRRQRREDRLKQRERQAKAQAKA